MLTIHLIINMLRLKFQSVSDIITNSSSELFQLKSDLTFETVKEMIEAEGRKNRAACPDKYWELPWKEQKKFDGCSGCGGKLEVLSWEDVFKRHAEWSCVPSKIDQFTPEMWALEYEESLDELKSMVWIDIDWKRYATMKFILENFWVTYADGNHYWQKDPETDKLVRVVTEEMYNALPENCRSDR